MSSSSELRQLLCETAVSLNLATLYEIQNTFKTVVSAIAIPVIVYMIITKKYLIYSEHHFMIHFKVVAILMFAINNMIVHGLQITDRLFNADHPCEWVREARDCVWFKSILCSSSAAMSSALCFITLERGILVVFQSSIRIQKLVGFVFSMLQVLITIYVTIVVWDINNDDTSLMLHCLEDSVSLYTFANLLSYFIIACDCTSLVGSLFIHFYCIRAFRLNNKLTRTFDLRQSALTIAAFLPLTIFHTASLLLLNVAGIILRPIMPHMDKLTMKAAHGFSNVGPYYSIIAPILLIYGLRRLRMGRSTEFSHSLTPKLNGKVAPESAIRHHSLQKMWS